MKEEKSELEKILSEVTEQYWDYGRQELAETITDGMSSADLIEWKIENLEMCREDEPAEEYEDDLKVWAEEMARVTAQIVGAGEEIKKKIKEAKTPSQVLQHLTRRQVEEVVVEVAQAGWDWTNFSNSRPTDEQLAKAIGEVATGQIEKMIEEGIRGKDGSQSR